MRFSSTFLLPCCILLTLVSACNDNLFHSVKLTSPANRSTVNPGVLTFTWRTKDNDPVRFLLATEDFKTTLMDSTLQGNSITYSDGLEPDSVYMWKVEQGDRSNTSTFRVVDFVEDFEGTYYGNVHSYSWVMGSSGHDTTYSAQIRLEKLGNEMRVTGDKELTLPFSSATDSSANYVYPIISSERALLELNFRNGSVKLLHFTGGLGGGTNYRFDAGN